MTKHGRSGRWAYGGLPGMLDSAAFFALVWLASGLWFQSRLGNVRAALPLSLVFAAVAGVGAFSLLSGRRERYRQSLNGAAYRLWLGDHIVRGSAIAFQRFLVDALCRKRGYLYLPAAEEEFLHLALNGQSYSLAALKRHPSCLVDTQALMDRVDAARGKGARNLIVASSAPYTPEALEYARSVGIPALELLSDKDLACLAAETGYEMPEFEARRFNCAAQALLKKERARRTGFSCWARPVRYAVSGVMLGSLSFLSPFRTWYLIMAGFCGLMAAALWARVRIRRPSAAPGG